MYIGLHFKQTNQKGSRVNNTLPTTLKIKHEPLLHILLYFGFTINFNIDFTDCENIKIEQFKCKVRETCKRKLSNYSTV